MLSDNIEVKIRSNGKRPMVVSTRENLSEQEIEQESREPQTKIEIPIRLEGGSVGVLKSDEKSENAQEATYYPQSGTLQTPNGDICLNKGCVNSGEYYFKL